MQLAGDVVRVIHQKKESGWSVLLVQDAAQMCYTVVGIFPDIVEGTSLEVTGEWKKHPTYGNQFKASSYRVKMPTTEYGIRKYLEWALPQVGAVRSRTIVDQFGSSTFDILDNDPLSLTVVPGITSERAEEIGRAWKEGSAKREAFIFLAQFNLTKKQSEDVIAYFKDDTQKVIEKDPYLLIEVSGLEFRKVDQVALSSGIGPNSDVRRRAAISYLMRTGGGWGHVYLTENRICEGLRNLELPKMDSSSWSLKETRRHLDHLQESSFVVRDSDRVYLSDMYFFEVASAYHLKEMVESPVGSHHLLKLEGNRGGSAEKRAYQRHEELVTYREEEAKTAEMLAADSSTWFEGPAPADGQLTLDDFLDDFQRSEELRDSDDEQQPFRDSPIGQLFTDPHIEKFLSEYQDQQGIEFSPAQREAVHMANKTRVFLLTGLPGTGKTTVLKAILELYRNAHLSVQLCAPTGKAAKRLSQVASCPAMTIHRYLGGCGDYWKHHEGNPAPHHAVIVDEFSMVDTRLMYRLMSALPVEKYLAMVGDPGQLPSVGPGSVLRDLIESGVVPRVHLEEIFRQSAKSGIVLNAHRIHKGKGVEDGDLDDFLMYWRKDTHGALQYLQAVCNKFKNRDIPFQVLSPKRRDGVGTTALNELLKPILNPGITWKPSVEWGDSTFHLDDKVIMTRNDYQKNVFNGDVGKIVNVNSHSREVSVVFEDMEMPEKADTEGMEIFFEDNIPTGVVKFQGEELRDLELAYALTVHKSQGSEWENVVLLMLHAHGRTLKRRLLYTAITRAKKRLILIGEKAAVRKAVASNSDDSRNTTLVKFLTEDADTLQKRIERYHVNSYPGRFESPSWR